MFNDVFYSKKSDNWSTPLDFFNSLNDIYHFDLDPCADDYNHKCDRYFTINDNGLVCDWGGHSVFVNPPFSDLKSWSKKCYLESLKPDTFVVLLFPARTDTSYFHDYILPYADLYFVRGRLKFGDSKNVAPFPCIYAVYRGEKK